MDLSRGCILIARSLDESDIFQNEKWLKVWIWCVVQANHKGKNVPVNIGRSKTSVWVDRGQFIFGRNKAAEKLGMSPSTVRNIMEKLDDLGNLDIKPDNHCSIVTITEYDFYQDMKNYLGQVGGQPKDMRGTTKGHAGDTTNTPKQPNTPKKKDIIKKPESVTEQTWADFITHRKNKKAPLTQTALNGFSKQANIAGYTIENAMKESIERGWTGFKAEWVKSDVVVNQEPNTYEDKQFAEQSKYMIFE